MNKVVQNAKKKTNGKVPNTSPPQTASKENSEKKKRNGKKPIA